MVGAADEITRIGDLAEWRRTRGAVRRRRQADPLEAAVIALVAAAQGASPADLLRATRCRAEIAFARQLAMYLTHVMLGRTLTEVGAVFGRDRTTVAHACALIEDRREGCFDTEVERLEAAISASEGIGIAGEQHRAAG